jgi:hypothetical protein
MISIGKSRGNFTAFAGLVVSVVGKSLGEWNNLLRREDRCALV